MASLEKFAKFSPYLLATSTLLGSLVTSHAAFASAQARWVFGSASRFQQQQQAAEIKKVEALALEAKRMAEEAKQKALLNEGTTHQAVRQDARASSYSLQENQYRRRERQGEERRSSDAEERRVDATRREFRESDRRFEERFDPRLEGRLARSKRSKRSLEDRPAEQRVSSRRQRGGEREARRGYRDDRSSDGGGGMRTRERRVYAAGAEFEDRQKPGRTRGQGEGRYAGLSSAEIAARAAKARGIRVEEAKVESLKPYPSWTGWKPGGKGVSKGDALAKGGSLEGSGDSASKKGSFTGEAKADAALDPDSKEGQEALRKALAEKGAVPKGGADFDGKVLKFNAADLLAGAKKPKAKEDGVTKAEGESSIRGGSKGSVPTAAELASTLAKFRRAESGNQEPASAEAGDGKAKKQGGPASKPEEGSGAAANKGGTASLKSTPPKKDAPTGLPPTGSELAGVKLKKGPGTRVGGQVEDIRSSAGNEGGGTAGLKSSAAKKEASTGRPPIESELATVQLKKVGGGTRVGGQVVDIHTPAKAESAPATPAKSGGQGLSAAASTAENRQPPQPFAGTRPGLGASPPKPYVSPGGFTSMKDAGLQAEAARKDREAKAEAEASRVAGEMESKGALKLLTDKTFQLDKTRAAAEVEKAKLESPRRILLAGSGGSEPAVAATGNGVDKVTVVEPALVKSPEAQVHFAATTDGISEAEALEKAQEKVRRAELLAQMLAGKQAAIEKAGGEAPSLPPTSAEKGAVATAPIVSVAHVAPKTPAEVNEALAGRIKARAAAMKAKEDAKRAKKYGTYGTMEASVATSEPSNLHEVREGDGADKTVQVGEVLAERKPTEGQVERQEGDGKHIAETTGRDPGVQRKSGDPLASASRGNPASLGHGGPGATPTAKLNGVAPAPGETGKAPSAAMAKLLEGKSPALRAMMLKALEKGGSPKPQVPPMMKTGGGAIGSGRSLSAHGGGAPMVEAW